MVEYHESQLITLANLNQVYRDVRERIDSLGHIYRVKGSITLAGLEAFDATSTISFKQGDVYNVSVPEDKDTDNPDPINPNDQIDRDQIVDGTNIVCKRDYSLNSRPADWEFNAYWEVLSGMLDEAADDTLGVIRLGSKIASDKNTNTGDVYRGVNLYHESTSPSEVGAAKAKEHQAYITMPIASKETYGVVSTGPQELAGNKIFNSDVIFEGNVTIPNTNVQQISKLTTNSIQLGNIEISTEGSKVIFGLKQS